ALVEGLQVFAVSHLREAVEHLTGEKPLPAFTREHGAPSPSRARQTPLDMSDVRGQADIKTALGLADAGGHTLLLWCPPGSGKTMRARRLPGILPTMTCEEALEVTKIYSVLGLLGEDQALMRERPYRAPHHTISDAGLVGGGPATRPGELSLAHHGVLFL